MNTNQGKIRSISPSKSHRVQLTRIILFTSLICSITFSHAQELEPRSLTNLPIGTNFALLGYGYAAGDILLDPALPIEDLDAKLNTFIGAYVRSIRLFGNSGKVNAILPYANGYWEGKYIGQDSSTSRTGFGDLRLGFSYNFLGSPALKMSDYNDYHQKTIFGLNFQLVVPIGQYNDTKLLNLGSNRWTFKPQLGLSQVVKKWTFEAYTSIWIFTTNNNFWGGNKLEQNPLFTFKVHVIRSLPKGVWIAANGGYGVGGKSYVNGEERESRISVFRFGLTVAVPVAKQHSLKLSLNSGRRLEMGADYDGIAISYQYRWLGIKDK